VGNGKKEAVGLKARSSKQSKLMDLCMPFVRQRLVFQICPSGSTGQMEPSISRTAEARISCNEKMTLSHNHARKAKSTRLHNEGVCVSGVDLIDW